jgi:dTDP-4-dehydrorhamnose 3,5-epimerase
MGALSLADVKVTPLAQIPTQGGMVMHAMKAVDPGYNGFGEAYFSWVEPGAVKAWKCHTRMLMNLLVPVGRVRFVFGLSANGPFRIEEIGPEGEYARITVPPGVWFGFQGRSSAPSLVLNLANIAHEPAEAQRAGVQEFQFNWD